MDDRDTESLLRDVLEKIEEFDLVFHDYGIEFLECEDDCNSHIENTEILRIIDLLKECKTIIDENM